MWINETHLFERILCATSLPGGDPDDEALGLRLLGEILARQQSIQAEQYFQESLALLEKLGERFEVTWILRSFANLLCDRGEFERAITLHQQAVSIFEEIGAERECQITQEKLQKLHT